MSDINDLIYTSAKIAYDQGVARERERIIKLIEELRIINPDHKFFVIEAINKPKHYPDCLLSEAKWDAGCSCEKGIAEGEKKV